MPLLRAVLAIAGGAAVVGAVVVRIVTAGGDSAPQQASAAAIAGSLSGAGALTDDGGLEGGPDGDDGMSSAARAGPRLWRVAQLADGGATTLVEGAVGHRSLLVALAAAGLPQTEGLRLTRSLAELGDVDRLDGEANGSAKESFVLARDNASGRVVAFEIGTSPIDVWQGRDEAQPDGTTRLVTRKLELFPTLVRVRKAVLVGADLRASLVDAGLGPVDEVLAMLDDALEGHAELSDIRPGARLRILATQERVDGVFVRWLSLDAVEYFPASAASVRVYRFGHDEGSKKHHGFYDAKARQPVHEGWRSPVPLARIASRFNPHRMHPVLHVVMPHNGVDFAAPVGAPVYATASGVVASVGSDGPCGNKVEIAHAGGVTSVYCHLSRFAAGLRVGQHVEQRQLIAYVGQTGRVTGPHLHFGIRRGGVFIDPMTLRLDGVRVVPRSQRDEFDRNRAEFDAELDAIPMPVPLGGAPEPKEPDVFYEEPP
ncbi:MAG: M23 family metallopeptidase [Myxococcota bacterium]|nr:M23 family metallopeptidase [Myxococcota bacterium]